LTPDAIKITSATPVTVLTRYYWLAHDWNKVIECLMLEYDACMIFEATFI
jgi:hypothetical protein